MPTQSLNRSLVNLTQKKPIKILQFGEGNFLRAFADWMIFQMNEKSNFNAGVAIVQPLANGLVDLLNHQNGLYNLYLRGLKNGEAVSEQFLIDIVEKSINPYQNYNEYLKLAENPDLQFVISNTTEAGITYEATDQLSQQPHNSFPAKLTALLYHRFNYFSGDTQKGLIHLPCELIDKNGANLKAIIVKYSQEWDLGDEFVTWLDDANVFCNTLVDRIVPGYPKERIEEIEEELGYKDQLVSEGEQFHLWVIETPEDSKINVAEHFPTAQADLNVIFAPDLSPYRTRKVRILNGAHTVMVPMGYLYGLRTVKETVEDGMMGEFVRQTIFEEIIPTLDLSKEELTQFANDVIDRFRNPYVKHYLKSIALNSLPKFETRVLPSLLAYAERKNEIPARLTFAFACLIQFYKGEWKGEELPVQDSEENIQFMKEAWSSFDGTPDAMKTVVEKVLSYEKNWKLNLNTVNGLAEKLTEFLVKIENDQSVVFES